MSYFPREKEKPKKVISAIIPKPANRSMRKNINSLSLSGWPCFRDLVYAFKQAVYSHVQILLGFNVQDLSRTLIYVTHYPVAL